VFWAPCYFQPIQAAVKLQDTLRFLMKNRAIIKEIFRKNKKFQAIISKWPGKLQALYCTRFHPFVHGFLLSIAGKLKQWTGPLFMGPEAFAYLGKGDKV
jgi:hypothetical protein